MIGIVIVIYLMYLRYLMYIICFETYKHIQLNSKIYKGQRTTTLETTTP